MWLLLGRRETKMSWGEACPAAEEEEESAPEEKKFKTGGEAAVIGFF